MQIDFHRQSRLPHWIRCDHVSRDQLIQLDAIPHRKYALQPGPYVDGRRQVKMNDYTLKQWIKQCMPYYAATIAVTKSQIIHEEMQRLNIDDSEFALWRYPSFSLNNTAPFILHFATKENQTLYKLSTCI